MKYVLSLVIVALGAAGIAFSAWDDAPGGVLIGLVLVTGGLAHVIRSLRRDTRAEHPTRGVEQGRLRLAVVPLRVLMVLTFAALVGAEVMSFPGGVTHDVKTSGDESLWPWVRLAVLEFWMLSVQLVIVCTWKLLTMVRDNTVFSGAALTWVDIIIWVIGGAWIALFAVFVSVVSMADDPGTPFALLLVVLPGAGFALLVVVMRALLAQATTLRDDMEAVI